MGRIVRISIEEYDNGISKASKAQDGEDDKVKVVFRQRGIMLTPKKYKQLLKIMNEIKELIV